MEVTIAGEDRVQGEKLLHEICHKVLANPVIEEYRFELLGGAEE